MNERPVLPTASLAAAIDHALDLADAAGEAEVACLLSAARDALAGRRSVSDDLASLFDEPDTAARPAGA